MDDHEILQHLLGMEAQAASLVDDAQAEADRKISEAETQNRVRYDEVCAREAKILKESLIKERSAAKDDYRKQLEAYRENLKTMSVNMEAFSSLMKKFLIVAVSPSEES